MMRKQLFFSAVVLSLTGLMLFSCGPKSSQKSTETTFEEYLTDKDSATVIQLVNDFFFYAEQGNYAEAAAMLYKVQADSVEMMPEPLNNEEMKEIVDMLKMLGIQGHRIDYIKFKEYYLNEVKCTAILQEASDGMPEATTTFYFKPIDYIDSWVLCLMHSATGNNPFVQEDEKAQLSREYKADQYERAEKAAEAEAEAQATDRE